MRPLNNDERIVMRHALGLDNGKTIYRNRYFAGGRDEKWEALVAIGAANRNVTGPCDKWSYWVTRNGAMSVLEDGERHDGETAFDHIN